MRFFTSFGRAVRLAWSLVRIPHVTLSLFLFPTLASLVLVFIQLVGTGIVIRAMSADTRLVSTSLKDHTRNDVRTLRRLLYGSYAPRPALTVCRWVADPASASGEAPPTPECYPDRLDVAIHTDDPASLNVDRYMKWFEGETDRIHVCRTCSPDVVIRTGSDGKRLTETRSIYGLTVLYLGLTRKDDKIMEKRAEFIEILGDFQDAIGSTSMLIPEAGSYVQLSHSNPFFPFTINVVLLVLTSLWLALRAHRKVLEYFSQNGVLLPLVAATGKRAFYSAVWLLTIARVSCFLFAAVPMVYLGLKDIGGQDIFSLLQPHAAIIVLWCVVLVVTLGLLTTVASIADLKHRESVFSIMYRYLPFACAMLGALAWTASFIFASEAAADFRLILASFPVVGLMPLLIAPIIKLPLSVLILHGAISLVAVVIILRANSTWFAAHLEEV